MSAVILDGKKVADQIRAELVNRIQTLSSHGVTPGLAAVLVGEDPASAVYVSSKTRMCSMLGLYSRTHTLPKESSEAALLKLIDELNHDARVHGILVQLPLPAHINPQTIFEALVPEKDVDGFSPINRGRLQVGQETFVPCTPAGVQELLVRSGFRVEGKHVVVVGRSSLVGMPLAVLLAQKNPRANATVTICHSGTRNLDEITRSADVVVAAIGKAGFVRAQHVREGAVVVDVGINRVEDRNSERGYRLVGDVDFEGVREKAAAITPVPGGIGPMTIIMLMQNTVRAAERLHMRQ